MNVLVLDQFSELGGAQRCLLDLVPAFRDRGWHLHGGLPGDGPLIGRFRRYDIPVEAIPLGSYTSARKTFSDFARFATELPRLIRAVSRLIDTWAIDLVYVNGPRVLPAAVRAAGGRPVIFHAHNRVIERLPAWLLRRSLRTANTTVVAACRYVAEPFKSSLDPARLHVIYNGVPEIPFAPRPAPRDGAWRIGVIGRIAPEKGQAVFLGAAQLIHSKLPAARFLVCGAPMFADSSYFDAVKKLAAGLPVEFTGWQEDIPRVLADLDLLVVPSASVDATPRVILEAFSAGVPVVAFSAGGIPEIVEDGRTGFLVSLSSPDALAAAVINLLREQPQRLAEASTAARQAWRRKFNLDRYRADISSVIAGAAKNL